MGVRLDQIEGMLRAYLGSAMLAAAPDLLYSAGQVLYRFMRTGDSLEVLWHQLDSLLFNTVYLASGKTMLAVLDDGRYVQMTDEVIKDLADRVLSLAYHRMDVCPTLQSALYDFSRAGSYAAMRELLDRFPMDETERNCIYDVLRDNNQLT